jgi:3-oxoacyl-[acyl-carrier protein] reductase
MVDPIRHDSLAGKNALVTGATRGIGRAIVHAFAARGANVAFTFRTSVEHADALKGELATTGIQALAFQGDAADSVAAEESVNGVLDAWGTLDVLVNNAGITRDGLLLRMSEDDWDAVINTNLKGVYNFCKAAYRPMIKQRSGRIINLSSIAGLVGNAGQTNYAASKAGIIGFSKSLARELAGRNVTVNVVAPGYVATDMTAAMTENAQKAMLGAVPLGHAAEPEDIASAVVFLASEGAKYITGHVLNVDGGLAM